MSPLPRIHTSTFATITETPLTEPSSGEHGFGSTQSVFSEVMREAFNSSPHITAHKIQNRSHAHLAQHLAGEEENSPNRISQSATRTGPVDTRNISGQRATSDTEVETPDKSSIFARDGQDVGRASDLTNTQAQSVSPVQTVEKGNSTAKASAKRSLDDSTIAGAQTRVPQKDAQVSEGATSSSGTVNTLASAPATTNEAVSGSLNFSVRKDNSKSVNMGEVRQNVFAGNLPAGTDLSSPGQSVEETGNRDETFQDGILREVAPLDAKVDAKTNKSLPENRSNSLPSIERDEKQSTLIAGGNDRNTINAASQSENQSSAATGASSGESPATTSTQSLSDPASGSTNGSVNVVSPAGTTSSSNVVTGNENVSGNNSESANSNINGSSGVSRNAGSSKSSIGITSSGVTAERGSNMHVPATISPSEVLHRTALDGEGLHSRSDTVSGSGSSGSSGNSNVAHATSSIPRGAASDAFMALDSGATSEHGVLLHADPHQVAVGVADPALGWVEVRADRVNGQITAALTADSIASHAALTSALSSMTTYLQDHHIGVQHLHVETGLAGNQAETGSQGQSSRQDDSRGTAGNGTAASGVVRAGGQDWGGPDVSSAPLLPSMAPRPAIEGHQVSIRA